MTTQSAEQTRHLMQSGDRGAWSLAALTVALAESGSEEQMRAAVDLLGALGIDVRADLGELDRAGAAAQAAAPLLQTAALVSGDGMLWAGQSNEALLTQGRASAQGAAAFVQFGLPRLPGLAEALARPGARMLDIGTGVAALAVAYAELFPELTVIGVDVLPHVLGLAAEIVAASTVADRVVLREQDVSTLDDEAAYVLAWIPAPFVPPGALRAGMPRLARALAPGGWAMVGHGKYAGDPVEDALSRFKTVAYGGTALNDDQAQQMLRDVGLGNVMTLPTPLGAPAITVGRNGF